MGKKSRRPAGATTVVPRPDSTEVPVVGGREPCPCGSGKRYKACHGRAALVEATRLVTRPFKGLPAECDWVAMREIVPAATATVGLDGPNAGDRAGSEVTVVTMLPMAWPAMHRLDGTVLLGLQTAGSPSDPSRTAAGALLAALDAEPGTPVADPAYGGTSGARLQDLIAADATFGVSMHEGFDFWLEGNPEITPEVRDSLERTNGAVVPTRRLSSVAAAYWCQIGERRHLRWVLPHPEAVLMDAIARLHSASASDLGPGTRYVGSFRAHGLLVPVWDLTSDAEADDVEAPAAEFEQRLLEAMADATPLSAEERRARNGVASRQLTLR